MTGNKLLHLVSRYGLLIVLALLVVAFSAAKPHTFGTWGNFKAILSTEATIVFLATAAVLPLVVGEFDLSIAAVLTLAQVLAVGLILQHDWSVPAAIGVALVAALVVGAVNGTLVAAFGINSFIATLATGSVVSGATLAYSQGQSIYGAAPHALTSLARNDVAGIPLPAVWALALAALLTLVLLRHPVGRRMYAIGGNPSAAEKTGIPRRRYLAATFVCSALLAAIGGVLLGARLGAASSDNGQELLIPAFAAAFLGATVFTPGRFNVAGAVVAVYVVGVAVTGLQQFGVALWVQPVFEGGVLLLAVGLSAWTARARARRARAARLRELEHRASPPEPAVAEV